MQIATHYQQVFFGFNNRTLESALKQMPDHLMPMIKVDRVRGVQQNPLLREVARKLIFSNSFMMVHHDAAFDCHVGMRLIVFS